MHPPLPGERGVLVSFGPAIEDGVVVGIGLVMTKPVRSFDGTGLVMV